MAISDLLTLIGILLAIFAFISEKNRNFIVLKFSTKQRVLLGASFLYVHFLISFDWWLSRINSLSLFCGSRYPSASSWAYILSITTLGWSIWRIFKGQFPPSNRARLIEYYDKLLIQNDTAFLAELVEEYHLKNIIDYLRAKKSIEQKLTGIPVRTGDINDKTYEKVMHTSSRIYGGDVFRRVIRNDAFIDIVANLNPYLFTNIISELNDPTVRDWGLVNRFLKTLTLNKNSNFFREIRNVSSGDNLHAFKVEDHKPIIYSLLHDVRVASVNEAWRGIANQAIIEIQNEAKKDFSELREADNDQDGDTIWDYRITIAIAYFDLMVKEAIQQNVKDHMWMFYYKNFTEGLFNNMRELPYGESEINRGTRNYDLIKKIFSNMMDWISIAIDSKKYGVKESIFSCMGDCLIIVTSSIKISDNEKHYFMNWIWEDLIQTADDEEEKEEIESFVNRGFEMFKRPSAMFLMHGDTQTKIYLALLKRLWEERDYPILTGLRGFRAAKFKKDVIDNLFPANEFN